MSKNALAFVAGLGTGYLSQSEREKDRERQAKKDAQDDERHEAAMDEVKAKRKTRQAMADAGAERKVVDGTAVDTGSGQNLYTDPAQAAAAAEDARIEADMRGQDPSKVKTMAAKGITGDMSVGHKITAEPVDVAKLNTREAQDTRAVANLRGLGEFEKSSQLESNIRTGKVQDMQLQQGEEAQARDKTFREITNQFVRGGWGAVPKIYEGYNDGNTAQVKPDGKGGALVTTFNAKGEKVGEQAFANEMEFISTAIANVDPKLWVGMREKKADAARDQGNKDRDFELRKAENESQAQYRNRMAGIQESQNTRAAELHKLTTAAESKFPPAVKLRAEGLRKELETIASAQAKAMAENSYESTSSNALALATKQAAANKQLEELLKPYMKGFEGAGSDPLGIGAKPAAPAQAPAAASPAAPLPAARPIAATAGTLPPAPTAAPVAAPAKAPDQFAKMRADNVAAITPMVLGLKQAQMELAAVARSGDSAAIKAYVDKVSALRAQVMKDATAKFADQAGQIVDQILAQ